MGVLFQIMIPVPIADQVVYPCREYGIPAEYSGLKVSEVYESVKKDPDELLNLHVQGRMLTSALVTPGNDITMYTYGCSRYFQTGPGMDLTRKFDEFFSDVVIATLEQEKKIKHHHS